MSRKRRTSSAEARKSQSKVSSQDWVSSSNSGSRSPGRNCRRSTIRASGESETAAIRSDYTKAGLATTGRTAADSFLSLVTLQELLNRLGSLLDAMLVLDQRETHESFA